MFFHFLLVYRWPIFFIWVLMCIIPFVFYYKSLLLRRKTISISIPFITLVIIIVLVHFLFLDSYPYVAIYDQVRDGGLNTAEIVQGTLPSIFSYGRYASHGLIIPTINSVFYLFFQNSVFTYRIPAAILGIIDTLLLYFLVSKIVNKRAGLWSALVLISLPLHLYYARTEIVVMWSEFFTLVDLLLLQQALKYTSKKEYLVLGLALGFSSGLHTSVRTISLLIGVIAIAYTVYQYFLTKKIIFLQNIFYVLFFYLIGFGPHIFYTTPALFFQIRSFTQASLLTEITRYIQSLLVYIYLPTKSLHYPDFKPLLTAFLSIFLLLGIFVSLCSKKIFLYILLALLLVLPLTNSAITDMLNADNRLLPQLVIAAVFVGIGIAYFLQKMKLWIKNPLFIDLLQTIMIGYLLFQCLYFFFGETANKKYTEVDYLSMHTIYTLQKNTVYTKLHSLCFFVSSYNLQYFSQQHVQEQYQYFLQGKRITIIPYKSIPTNQLLVSSSCNNNHIQNRSEKFTFCSPEETFICPPHKGPLEIFVENPKSAPTVPSSIYKKIQVIPINPILIP